MEMRETSRRPPGTHFVDIHEVPEEEEEEVDTPSKSTAQKHEKRFNKAIKVRETKRSYNNRGLRKQVSLETGFSVLNGEKSERGALPRSGKSFAGFGSSNSAELVRKGDFNIFRTQSSLLSRQNSKVPLRKESGILDSGQFNDVFGKGVDESLNKSVPAGRYFAALTGPELDQVKVLYSLYMW